MYITAIHTVIDASLAIAQFRANGIHPTYFIFHTKRTDGAHIKYIYARTYNIGAPKAEELVFWGVYLPRVRNMFFNGRLTHITSPNKFRDEEERKKKRRYTSIVCTGRYMHARTFKLTRERKRERDCIEHLLQWKRNTVRTSSCQRQVSATGACISAVFRTTTYGSENQPIVD